MTKINIGAVSLGCDKNRVETEKLLNRIKNSIDCEIVNTTQDADVILINTCGFIASAVEESINTIFDMSDEKRDNALIIVTGCMVSRYAQDLKSNMPEVDAFFAHTESDDLINFLISKYGKKQQVLECGEFDRVLTTPSHYAYLRIADGCNNFCSYCTIPYIRGRFTSVKIEDLVAETQSLLDNYYIKELDIVAQDVTRYGYDIYSKYAIIDLLDKLCATDVEKIRLNYCYPELITDDLLKYVSENPKICSYLDIPLQHVDDRILKAMNRRSTEQGIRTLLDKIRSANNYVSIRSTFISGFPTETEAEHQKLIEFLKEYKLDNVGFFAYSKEEGTAAAKMKGQIHGNTKTRRVKELNYVQQSIMNEMQSNNVGKTVQILVDGIDYDRQSFYGHTEYDAPDVDKKVYFTSDD